MIVMSTREAQVNDLVDVRDEHEVFRLLPSRQPEGAVRWVPAAAEIKLCGCLSSP